MIMSEPVQWRRGGILVVLATLLSCATAEPHWAGARLSPGTVGRVMLSRMGEVQKCYSAELKKNSKIAGTVLIEFTLGARGHVGTAALAEYDESVKEVGLCIVRDAYNWTFPAPEAGSATLSYPFSFAPRQQE